MADTRQAGPVRLYEPSRAALLDHLLALDADDRYGRFAFALSDDGVADYVAGIDFVRDLCFGFQEADGRFSGFIHLAVYGPVAELGASVLRAWRRQGRARQLFARALACAQDDAIRDVHLATGHPVACRICAGLGYGLRAGAGYPRMTVLLTPSAPNRAAMAGGLEGK